MFMQLLRKGNPSLNRKHTYQDTAEDGTAYLSKVLQGHIEKKIK